MKTLDKLVKFSKKTAAGALIGAALISGYGCADSKTDSKRGYVDIGNPQSYSLSLIGNKVLGSGFERPEGLKIKLQGSQSPQNYAAQLLIVDSNGVFDTTFLERPQFETDKTFIPQNEPKINGFSGTLTDINNGTAIISNRYTFQQNLASEFDTSQYKYDGGILTPVGLYLRMLQLGSDYVVSKNSSNRISKVSGSLESTFAQDDELIGTVDMILGGNQRIYLAQSMLVNCENLSQNQWTVARSRRVISMDPNDLLNPDNSLKYNLEFTLPDGAIPIALTTIPGKSCYPTDDMVRMVENLNVGFYALDFLNNKLYTISAGVVSTLRDFSQHPTALAMEQNGKLLVALAPVLQGDPANPTFISHSKIDEIDPSDSANDITLSTLDESATDFAGLLFPEDPIQNTWTPRAYSPSLAIAETPASLTALVSDTASGSVSAVEFQKVAAP